MILKEVCSLLVKKYMTKLGSRLKKILKPSVVSSVFIGSLLAFLVVTSNAHAFSLDQPRVQSYIGQPLSVFIPVSVEQNERLDANSLIVARPSPAQIENLGLASADYKSFQYQVVKINDTVGVLITSRSSLNEPYVNLIVQVVYKGKTRIKPYPILLDLPPSIPSTQTQNGLAQLPSGVTSENVNNALSDDSASSNVITYSPEIMGAYDWAQKGAIPKKFGPVIDGQSLWRVARRINKAMGVSIDQMAWGLYRANPSAFASDSVESLQAGSTLSIPEESFVREVTELQAVRLLGEKQSNPVASEVQPSNVTTDAAIVEPNAESNNSPSDEEPTVNGEGVSQPETVNPEFTMSGIETSQADQEVISTLNSTVAELSEQLLMKDQRITFLEKQIEQLTGIKQADLAGSETNIVSDITAVGDQVIPTDDAVVALDSAEQNIADDQQIFADGDEGEITPEIDVSDPELIDSELIDSELAPELTPELTTEVPSTIDPSTIDVVSNESGLESATEQTPINITSPDIESTTALADDSIKGEGFWNWKKYLMLGLLGVIALAIFFREMIVGTISRLFSSEDEIVLNIPSVIDAQSRAAAMESPFPDVVPEIVHAETGQSTEDDHDAMSDDFDDDFFLEDEESVDVEEMNLSDRIKQLLNAGNFGEAQKTIDFAQEANMDEKYLDFCRLKIFAAEQNKPEFAKTFNRVNRRINDFHPEIQFKIAELHREMFDSEAVIDFGFIEEED